MKIGKKIGIGNTACVYEWEDGKVIKLFNQGYPMDAIEKEYYNSLVLNNLNFLKPKAYEMISYKDKIGIIYDKINGESLLDWIFKNGDIHKCAVYMARLHKSMLQNKINDVPFYKDFLKLTVSNALLTLDEQEKCFHAIDELADGDTLCHGDFHLGNIIISEEVTFIIDFMNICRGNLLYDVARAVFLLEYTPVPEDAQDKNAILALKKELADAYLMQMNITREMIEDYLSVILIARKGEYSG